MSSPIGSPLWSSFQASGSSFGSTMPSPSPTSTASSRSSISSPLSASSVMADDDYVQLPPPNIVASTPVAYRAAQAAAQAGLVSQPNGGVIRKAPPPAPQLKPVKESEGKDNKPQSEVSAAVKRARSLQELQEDKLVL